MKTIEQNILTVPSGIIGHQVNAQSRMGAGLAGQIAKKWPHSKTHYMEVCRQHTAQQLMGRAALEEASCFVYVCHLFGQEYYGRSPGRCYTNYSFLSKALHSLYHQAAEMSLPVFLPHGIGCGLAGGDWNVVQELIKESCPIAVICKWDFS